MLPTSEYIARGFACLNGYQLRRPTCLVFESTSRCQLDCEVCCATPAFCSRTRGLME